MSMQWFLSFGFIVECFKFCVDLNRPFHEDAIFFFALEEFCVLDLVWICFLNF
jgi:hypothetical protein